MIQSSAEQLPKAGSQVTTACGSEVQLGEDTPFVKYKERLVFFCLPACKEDFEREPRFSCLAVELILGEE